MLISKRAENDLREIWRWSFEQFGEAQADRYLDELDSEFQAQPRSLPLWTVEGEKIPLASLAGDGLDRQAVGPWIALVRRT